MRKNSVVGTTHKKAKAPQKPPLPTPAEHLEYQNGILNRLSTQLADSKRTFTDQHNERLQLTRDLVAATRQQTKELTAQGSQLLQGVIDIRVERRQQLSDLLDKISIMARYVDSFNSPDDFPVGLGDARKAAAHNIQNLANAATKIESIVQQLASEKRASATPPASVQQVSRAECAETKSLVKIAEHTERFAYVAGQLLSELSGLRTDVQSAPKKKSKRVTFKL